MLVPASALYGLVLLAAFHGSIVDALVIRGHHGFQLVAKSPRNTEPSTLLQRKDDACGADMPRCSASSIGNCCPESYDGQAAVDTTPTSVPKYVPSSIETDGDDGEDESLSTTQLGGIIGGAIALLALVIAAACVMIRHIDKLAAQISRKSNSSRSRTTTKQTSLSSLSSRSSRTDSTEASTRRSQTRRKTRSTARRHRQRRNGFIAASSGDFLIQGAHGRLESAQDIPLQVLTRTTDSCSAVVLDSRRMDVVSPTAINDVSPRQLSSPSPLSVASSELGASSLAQELAGTSNAVTLAADSLIHDAQDIPPTDLPRVATRPPLAYQWMRSIGLLRESETTDPEDYRIEEESHGFYGSRDHVAGRTGLGIGYTEMRGGGPGHYFCPMPKRTYGSV